MGLFGLLAVLGWSLLPAPAGAVDAAVRLERARIAYAAGRYEAALAEYDAMLKLEGEDAAVRNNRALCFLALGRLDRARWESERAIELAPGEGWYLITLAVIQMSLKPPELKAARANLEAAIKPLKRARDRQGLANACYNLGVIAHRQKKFEDAREWYKLSLEYDPSNEDAREALKVLEPGSAG
jgi:tetratricopeptide (TPR) repeat protein